MYEKRFKNWNYGDFSKDIELKIAPNKIEFIQLTIKKGTLLWRTSSVKENFENTRANPSWYSFDLVLSMYYGTSKYVTLYEVKEDITKLIQWEYAVYTPRFDSDPFRYLYSFPDVAKIGRNKILRNFSTTAEQENVIRHMRNKDFNGWVNYHSEEIILMDALDFLTPLHTWERDNNFETKTYHYPERTAMGLTSYRKVWNPKNNSVYRYTNGISFINNFISQTTTYLDEYTYRTQFYKKLSIAPSEPADMGIVEDFDYYNSRRCMYALLRYYTRYDLIDPGMPHRSIRIDKTYMGNEIKYLQKYADEMDLNITIQEVTSVDKKTNESLFIKNWNKDPFLYVFKDRSHKFLLLQNKQLFYTPYQMPHLNYISKLNPTAQLFFCETELPSYQSNPIPALVYIVSLLEGHSNEKASSNSRKKAYRQIMRDIMDEYMISEKTFNISNYFDLKI